MDVRTLVENSYNKHDEQREFLAEVLEFLLAEGDTPDRPSSIPFPIIKITELWGQTTASGRNKNDDRKRIEKFTARIPGKTVAQKLEGINSVIDYNPRIDLPRIMSTLVFLELMRSIVVEYTESVSGFLFEGFLAGLFGGKSVQVTDVKGKAAEGQVGKPITDVELNGRDYSLKLLSPKTLIEGSFKNLVHHFEARDEVVYLTLRKEGDGILLWYEFTITLPTFVTFIGHASKTVMVPVTQDVEVLGSHLATADENLQIEIDGKKYTITKVVPTGGERRVPRNRYVMQGTRDPEGTYILSYETGETREEIGLTASGRRIWGEGLEGIENYRKAREMGGLLADKTGADKGSMIEFLKTVPGYADKAAQFEISRAYADKLVDGGDAELVGTLDLSEEKIRGVAEQYAAKLNEELVPIYSALDSFTKNINSYFLTGKHAKSRFAHADAASTDAKELETKTRKIVKGGDEADEGP